MISCSTRIGRRSACGSVRWATATSDTRRILASVLLNRFREALAVLGLPRLLGSWMDQPVRPPSRGESQPSYECSLRVPFVEDVLELLLLVQALGHETLEQSLISRCPCGRPWRAIDPGCRRRGAPGPVRARREPVRGSRARRNTCGRWKSLVRVAHQAGGSATSCVAHHAASSASSAKGGTASGCTRIRESIRYRRLSDLQVVSRRRQCCEYAVTRGSRAAPCVHNGENATAARPSGEAEALFPIDRVSRRGSAVYVREDIFGFRRQHADEQLLWTR